MSQKHEDPFIDLDGFGLSKYHETKADFIMGDDTTREVVELFYHNQDEAYSEYGIFSEIESSGSNLQRSLEMLDGRTRLDFLLDEEILEMQKQESSCASGYSKNYRFNGFPEYLDESEF